MGQILVTIVIKGLKLNTAVSFYTYNVEVSNKFKKL